MSKKYFSIIADLQSETVAKILGGEEIDTLNVTDCDGEKAVYSGYGDVDKVKRALKKNGVSPEKAQLIIP